MATLTSQSYYCSMNGTLKTFIRETVTGTEEISIRHAEQLNFHGDEAKIVYESIINDNNEAKKLYNTIKSKSHCNKKEVTKLVCDKNNAKSKKIDKSSKGDINIDANKILKAVEQGDIKYLKDNLTNENVNIADNYGWTPLMSAAYSGNVSIVEFLLKLGANKKTRDKSNLTALQLAQKKNHLDIIRLLKAKKLIEKKEKNSQNNSSKTDEFYCSICKATFKDTIIKKHETSTLHLFNTNPKLPDPRYGIPTENKGYQIMVNNGWEESKGLGPTGSGLKYPVKTVLKRDRKGFGIKPKIQARVTHFQSGDTNAVLYVNQLNKKNVVKSHVRKRDREKLNIRERKKEIALRQALS